MKKPQDTDSPAAEATYRIQQFAARAGVTIKALRHYDRLGLLRPRRTASGYRVYTDQDLAVLAQIVALRFIGIPLRQIPLLRGAAPAALANALRAQRQLLEEKRGMLRRAVDALTTAERDLASGARTAGDVFAQLIEVIDMEHNNQDWKGKYDTLVESKIDRLRAMTPEALAALRSEWATLLGDIRTAIPRGASDPGAAGLASRWLALLGQMMGQPADPAFVAHYQSRDWTPAMASFVDEPTWTFMREVLRARQP